MEVLVNWVTNNWTFQWYSYEWDGSKHMWEIDNHIRHATFKDAVLTSMEYEEHVAWF